MYGVQIKDSGNRKVRTMMRLRRNESDTSMCNPGWQAFSESVVSLFVAANYKVWCLLRVAGEFCVQGFALRTNTCALTSGSSGSTNSPL